MSEYRRLYREADVLDRWASIYGGKRLAADAFRFRAAVLRLQAELIKAARIEEMAAWAARRWG